MNNNAENNEIDPNAGAVAFVRPARIFKGMQLRQYTLGTKILWFMIVDLQNDHSSWIVLSLMYLLSLDKKEAQRLAFDKAAFRSGCLDWIDSLEEKDITEATALFTEITSTAEATKVDVAEDGESDPKKD